MKINLTIFFFIAFMGLKAQSPAPTNSNDSIQLKLDEYKKLYDAGIIGDDEYNKMKSQLLAAPPAAPVTIPSAVTPANTTPPVNIAPQTPQAIEAPKTTDSTQVKLDQYKKLFDSGVISEDEYNRLKGQATGHPVTETRQVVKPDVVLTKGDTMSMAALHDRYKGRTIAGTVILSVGGAFIIGDIFLAALSPKFKSTDTLYSEKVATRRGSEIALGVLGGVAAIGGGVFLALGLKDRAIYRRRGKEITMNFTGKEFEIAFNF